MFYYFLVFPILFIKLYFYLDVPFVNQDIIYNIINAINVQLVAVFVKMKLFVKHANLDMNYHIQVFIPLLILVKKLNFIYSN